MAKQKKHPKLPNGFGSIKKLSGNRSNPYGVYPPTTEFTPDGIPVAQKAICYVPDWYTGFYALMCWRNGTFDENTLKTATGSGDQEYDIASRILAAYNASARTARNHPTFAEVYDGFFDYKYNRDRTRTYSPSAKSATVAAYKNCRALHARPFIDLTTQDLQQVIDDCPLKHASKELIVTLFKQMYAYADMNDLCIKDYSAHVKINTPDDDENGIPFSVSEINAIWAHADDSPILRGILIMIYSGFRIKAYQDMEINMSEGYFRGGVKTRAGKNRIVPFCPVIEQFVDPSLELFHVSTPTFRKRFAAALDGIGIHGHTPHDCRHTFSWLCDKYGVDRLSKKILLGHSLGSDVTDSRYGHRTTEELRTEIAKIRHW